MTRFQSWQNFGYAQEDLRRFDAVVARDNLRAVESYCKFCIPCLLVLTVVRIVLLGWQPTGMWLCAGGCAIWCILLLLSVRRMQDNRMGAMARILPVLFIIGTCAQSFCDDILLNPNRQNVLLCIVLMASGILFDLKTTSLCALLGAIWAGAAWTEWHLAPDMLALDMMNELLACIVGIAIGRQRIRLKIGLMISEERRAQEREREMQMQLKFSQIQPHFIYNTLSVIRSLCRTNPPAAVDTLDEFAAYLRANLDASAQENPMIPFRQELANVQHYLSLEQRRFGERVRVALDIQADDFSLPAMTLQPLAENAVKHGLSRKEGGGTVTIATAEADGVVTIEVRDDGVGFAKDAPEDDERVHLGLENVRTRFETLRGGTMHIRSEIGHGTAVTLKFSKNTNRADAKSLVSVDM